MGFEEFLKTVEGLTDEQIAKITGGMKENKLYISGEENIDERYTKLKGQHDESTVQLADAQKLIGEMKAASEGNEGLQAKVAEYEQKAAEAEDRAAKAERDAAVKVELLAKGAVPDDIDYLMYRIEQGETEVKLGDDGKLSGIDDAITALKTQHPNQFKGDGAKKFEGAKLPPSSAGTGETVTKEQFDRMSLSERTELYNTNREAYDTLAGKK